MHYRVQGARHDADPVLLPARADRSHVGIAYALLPAGTCVSSTLSLSSGKRWSRWRVGN